MVQCQGPRKWCCFGLSLLGTTRAPLLGAFRVIPGDLGGGGFHVALVIRDQAYAIHVLSPFIFSLASVNNKLKKGYHPVPSMPAWLLKSTEKEKKSRFTIFLPLCTISLETVCALYINFLFFFINSTLDFTKRWPILLLSNIDSFSSRFPHYMLRSWS